MTPRCSSARSVLRSLCLAAALVAAAQPSPGQSPASPATGRPVVLMVHGRGVSDRDSTNLRREWLDALNQGMVGVGGTAPLGAQDFRLVWYADALDPRVPNACRHPGAASPPNEIGSLLATVGALFGVVAELTDEQEAEALRALGGDLLYLGDDRKRCAAEERLEEALARAAQEGRPVILIAHSFGSLVAYRHLETRAGDTVPAVQRLITVGSLVGRGELRELLLGARGRRLELPARVGSWVNVRDPEDALSVPLNGVARDSANAARILDRRTERTARSDPHDASHYLIDPATAKAVRESWCLSLDERRNREPICVDRP